MRVLKKFISIALVGSMLWADLAVAGFKGYGTMEDASPARSSTTPSSSPDSKGTQRLTSSSDEDRRKDFSSSGGSTGDTSPVSGGSSGNSSPRSSSSTSSTAYIPIITPQQVRSAWKGNAKDLEIVEEWARAHEPKDVLWGYRMIALLTGKHRIIESESRPSHSVQFSLPSSPTQPFMIPAGHVGHDEGLVPSPSPGIQGGFVPASPQASYRELSVLGNAAFEQAQLLSHMSEVVDEGAPLMVPSLMTGGDELDVFRATLEGLDEGLGEKGLQVYGYDKEKRRKILKALAYMGRYSIENETTGIQWVGMAAAGAIGALAAWPDESVYAVGFNDIFYHRLNWEFVANPILDYGLAVYVAGMGIIDNAPRMISLARRGLSPLDFGFSHRERNWKGHALMAMVACASSVPIIVQLFYFADATRTLDNEEDQDGVEHSNFKKQMLIWGTPYVIEAAFWSYEQLWEFQEYVTERLFYNAHRFKSEASQYRHEMQEGLHRMMKAFYWIPNPLLQLIYDNVFNQDRGKEIKSSYSYLSEDEQAGLLASIQLQYLLSMSENIEEAAKAYKSGYEKGTELLSVGLAVSASFFRLLALQIVFKTMFYEFGFGAISHDVAYWLGWAGGILGSVPQGAGEIFGNLDYFQSFLPFTVTEQGDSSLTGLRTPAKVAATLHGAWSTIPLIALCLQTTDTFFSGNELWLIAASTYVFSEFTSGSAILKTTFVKLIPTAINKTLNFVRRLFGLGNSYGYMRDELAGLTERLSHRIGRVDNDVIMYLRNSLTDSSSSEESV